MAREAIRCQRPSPSAPHQSIAVRAGGLVFTSGFDISRGYAGAATPKDQGEQALIAVAEALDTLGGDVSGIGKLKLTVADWDSASAMSQSFQGALAPYYPARACVGGGLAGSDIVASVEVIASVDERPQPVGELISEWAAPRWGSKIGGLFLSNGVLAGDAAGPSLTMQAEDIFYQLGQGLAEAGQNFGDVVKVNGTPVAWHGLAAYNDVYRRHFPEPLAGRATIQGSLPRTSALIGLEIMAMTGEPRLSLQSGPAGVVETAPGAQHGMMRFSSELHPLKGPHSHGMRVGPMVFAAGACPYDRHDNLVSAGDIAAQTRQTLENLKYILRDLGCELDDIVKTNVTLSDKRLFAAFDAAYQSFFSPPYPARQTVIAGLAQGGMLVEIEAIAVVGAARTSIALLGATR